MFLYFFFDCFCTVVLVCSFIYMMVSGVFLYFLLFKNVCWRFLLSALVGFCFVFCLLLLFSLLAYLVVYQDVAMSACLFVSCLEESSALAKPGWSLLLLRRLLVLVLTLCLLSLPLAGRLVLRAHLPRAENSRPRGFVVAFADCALYIGVLVVLI